MVFEFISNERSPVCQRASYTLTLCLLKGRIPRKRCTLITMNSKWVNQSCGLPLLTTFGHVVVASSL